MSKSENNKKQSYKSVVTLILVSILIYMINYGLNIFLARILDKGLYGDFVIATKTFVLVASLLMLGTGASAKRFLSKYLRMSKEQQAAHYISWTLRMILLSSSIFLIALLIFLILLITLHLFNIKALSSYHLAMYMLFIAPLGSLALLSANYLQCNNNVHWYNFLRTSAESILLIGLFIVVFYFFGFSINIKSIWIIVFFAFIFLIAFEASVLFFKLPKNVVWKTLQPKETFQKKKWYTTAFNLIIMQVVSLLAATTDLYIVEIFTRNEVEVDQYAAILTISGLLYVVYCSVYKFISPRVSYCLASNQKNVLQKYINDANVINVLVVSLTFILLAWFGQPLMNQFGEHYATPHTYIALLITLSAYYIGSYNRPSILLISYSGQEKFLLIISFIQFALLIILGIPLTQQYDILGAALSLAISNAFRMIACVIIVNRRLKIKSLSIF